MSEWVTKPVVSIHRSSQIFIVCRFDWQWQHDSRRSLLWWCRYTVITPAYLQQLLLLSVPSV